jgi:hypothetical protein
MSYLRKGQTLPDGTYLYTCGKCNGVGNHGGVLCDWCYGLDAAQLCEQIKMARGERYYGLLKALLSIIGKQMVDYATSIRERQGKLQVLDIAHVHLKFDLNMKATWEWLYETRVIRTDYDAFKDSKLKVKDAEAAAIEKYGVIE